MADTSVKVSFIGDAKKLSKTIDAVDKDMDDLGKKSSSFGDKFSSAMSKTIPVLAGVGAGVAVLGSALKAAAEDEAEQAKLAATLRNVAGATQESIARTEKWIDAKQRASGIADSQLRPALDNLIRGTKDLDASTELLTLAMDIASGTGKDLETVSYALSAAYAGNMRGLQALSPDMKALIKDGMTADEAFAHLSATFKDQTAVQAETMQGKMARLKIAMDEAMESLGAKLMPVAIDFTNWMIEKGIPMVEDTAAKLEEWWAKQDGLKQAIKDGGEQLREFIEDLKTLIEWIKEAVDWTQKLTDKITSLPGGSFKGTDIPGVKQLAEKGLIDIIRGKASGGPVAGGMPYVVGEKGPELFVPGKSGTIVPNGGGWAGGAPTVIVLQLNGRELARGLADLSHEHGGLELVLR